MGELSIETLFADDSGNSEIAALIRSHFISTKDGAEGTPTPISIVETWPSSLKNAFGILVNSCCPMFLVWDCDPNQSNSDERILFYNDAYLSLLKQTQQLVPFGCAVKDSWTKEWHPIRSDVDQVFATGQPVRREQESFLNHHNSNSGRSLYSWFYSAIWNEAGQISGVFATGSRATVEERIAEEITTEETIAVFIGDQRFLAVQELQPSLPIWTTPIKGSPFQQVKAALRESEARFEAFMSHSPTSAWIADQAGRLLYLSPTYSQMFQFPQENVSGKQIHDLYPEEIAQQFLENNRRVFETGQVIETVETAPRPDGSAGSFLVYKFPITQAPGELLLGGVAIDITERKRIEETLQRREEELWLITNALPVLVAYVDKHYYYRFNNQTYEAWFGQPAASFTGRHVQEVLGEAAYETVRPYMEQVLSGQQVSFESQISYREGGIRYIKADYVPHINSLGEVEGYFSLVSDISERKQAEAEREQLLQELASERARFEAVLRQMPEGVIIADAASEALILANERTNQIFQYSFELNLELEEYDRRVPFHAYHPNGQAYAPDEYPLARSLRTGEIVSHEEMEIRYVDGHRIFIDANSSPIFDSQGQVTSAIVMIQEITERKQAEIALRQSEERAQLAIKVGRLGTWHYNLDLDAVELDERMREIWGEPDEAETISLPKVMERIHPDDRERVAHAIGAALHPSSSGTYKIDYRIIWDDGTERWVSANGQVLFDGTEASRQPVRFLGTALDITDRKQSEAALRQSEERLRLAQRAAGAGLWDWDIVTNQVTWSEEYYRLYGLDATVVPSYNNWLAAILEPDRESVAQATRQALEQRTNLNVEFRILHPTHGICWLVAIGQTFYDTDSDTDGKPVRMTGIALNITDRKQAEVEREQLLAREQSANETLQRFIERTPVAVVMLDREMRYLVASHCWMREYASGYTDLKGLSHYEVMTDIPERWRQAHQRCLAGATARCEEDYYLRADGSALWLYWEILPWYASDGEIGGIIIFAENITERKQAAQERETLLAREQKVRKEAEQANRIKDEFLAVLSHELRSPLNPILGWSKLLQSRQFDQAGTRRALETIERNARLQAQLIDDLLDISRILRGKTMLNVRPVDLGTVIDAALETVRLSAETKGIKIHKVIAGKVGLVSGDDGRFQQIIWNLLSNAVKFTPGGGQIEIRLEQVSTNAQIQVRDTGKGITPEFLPHVFEHFRQEDGTTTRKFGGLGLGLAIVRYLTELHGGTVEAESPGVGLGATFTVLLPISNNKNELPPDEAASSSSVAESLPLANVRILVVDDEADMRELIFTILEHTGAEIKMTASAIETLNALETFQPSILISDIGMPEMDGYELLRQIRSRSPEQNKEFPAIALTAYAGEINQQQALTAGFQRHIAKPVEPEELIQAIVSLVKS